ncbi:S8 family peptidase [Streptomyces sp. SAS_272]|uniref:S8 family peptidase n=1 Tax=Streptomyces sp. SAS_272 TaxID=3412747 RepID=UPI00403C5641
MTHRRKRARVAAAASVAAAVAMGLAAGTTGSPSAAAAAPAAPGNGNGKSAGAVRHWVTLITGDRVGVNAEGRPVTVQQPEGRKNVPVRMRHSNGHSYAVPLDAQRLIARGKLDERLFDVTLLSRPEYRTSQRDGLKVIVDYTGARPAAKTDVRGAGGTEVRRTLPRLNAEAVSIPQGNASDMWEAVTDQAAGGSAYRTAASGINKVWLDGIRRAALDTSVPQIGAPAAWSAGYTGQGVKIAVLDTGVDETHPDLAGRQIAEKNFSTAQTAKDANGHGTHVASTTAGSGAKSAGKYKGVAPDAGLLDGKVLNDRGVGDDSGVLAGMEWAVAQGADIVNLSLGGPDTPGIDPVEEAVNRLSADKGVLFVMASGNAGEAGDRTVGSPGSADAALTVGAVDGKDALAGSSSRGPRVGDSAVKPDVTAPGVAITAAAAPESRLAQQVGEKPAGYLTISGTSMATPHVTGAAALLKQQHPNWRGERIKSVLTGSAKGGPYSVFEQGSGRVDVAKAIQQTVFTEGPVSLSFGKQAWPHTDDTPVTRKIVYRNTGATDVTLDLSVTSTGPSGAAASVGFFALSADHVTVPAGGTAEVELSADTRIGTQDGLYSAYVTATGGGQSVRTAAGAEREIESYDLTLKHIGRNGQPTQQYITTLTGVSGLAANTSREAAEGPDTLTLRLPKGSYLLDSTLVNDINDPAKGMDSLIRPKLNLTKNTTVTLDARMAKAVNITVPDSHAKSVLGDFAYDYHNHGFGLLMKSFKNFRTAHLGAPVTDGSLYQQWNAHFTSGAKTQYDLTYGKKVATLATGYTKKAKASELATVTLGLGGPAQGKTGAVSALGVPAGSSSGIAPMNHQTLPGKRTLYLSTADGVKWGIDFMQLGEADATGAIRTETMYGTGSTRSYKAGKTYSKTFNTGVFSPVVTGNSRIHRTANQISASIPLLADSAGRIPGFTQYTSGKTVLYRNGTKIGEAATPTMTGKAVFNVPAAQAKYLLTTTVTRSTKISRVSTRIDASWTFTSKKVSQAAMPISTVMFRPVLGLDSTAKANAIAKIPVTVAGTAAEKGSLKSLTVHASYDGGKTWKNLTIKAGKVTVKNPAVGKGISFKATVTDKNGNKASVKIFNAYHGK